MIDFTGGEPLLHRNLPELLSMAKSLGFITTVTTNALLYPKKAERLKAKIDMLHFSLDYYDAEKHNRARRVDCYDYVIKSIEISKEIGERPDILMTVFNDNIFEIEPLYHEVCRKNDLVLILNPAFEYNEVDAKALSKSSLQILKKWSSKPGVYLNDAFLELRKNGGNHIGNPVCKAASSTIVISPENKLIVPCYHLGKKEYEIKDRLFDVYRSEEVKKAIKMEGRLPECEGCTINCYMQPSFAVEFNKYWIKALPSTIKYNLAKGTWKQLLPSFS